jgi:hypothetical protein
MKNSLLCQSDDYVKGFMVGCLTVFSLLLPTMVIVSAINLLPPLAKEIGLILFGFGIIIAVYNLKTVNRIEKHFRLWFEKPAAILQPKGKQEKEA